MTNEEAIAIIRQEYLCVDKDCDIERNCGKCDLAMPSKEPILEAYKVAIKALEQDTVSFDFELYEAGLMGMPEGTIEILDKIRAEIIDTGAYEQEVNGKTEFLKGINYCLSVIDKYMVEKG